MITKTEQEIMKNWDGNLITPVVSICCTTYNHEFYIAEAIDSFLMQKTPFPFEILIRDDCSTDKTADIILEYASKYPKIIKVSIELENQFEKGIKPLPVLYAIAKGNYIAICEGDDYWMDPYKLQKQVKFLQENNEYVITYSSVNAFNENGIIKEYQGGVTHDLSEEQLQKAKPINTLTVCYRNILNNFPKEFNYSFHGDLFLWSILGAYGKGKYLEMIEPSMYRVHEGGIHSCASSKRKKEMLLQTYTALFSYYSRKGNQKLAAYYIIKMVGLSMDIFGKFNFFTKMLSLKSI